MVQATGRSTMIDTGEQQPQLTNRSLRFGPGNRSTQP